MSETQVARALRTPRFKYCVTAPHLNAWNDSCSDVYVEKCLFDLDNDPYELKNLILDSAYADAKADLQSQLIAKIVASGEAKPRIVSL